MEMKLPAAPVAHAVAQYMIVSDRFTLVDDFELFVKRILGGLCYWWIRSCSNCCPNIQGNEPFDKWDGRLPFQLWKTENVTAGIGYYRKATKRNRTPEHMHWVMLLLLSWALISLRLKRMGPAHGWSQMAELWRNLLLVNQCFLRKGVLNNW